MLKTYIKAPIIDLFELEEVFDYSRQFEGLHQLYYTLQKDELQKDLEDELVFELEEAYNSINDELNTIANKLYEHEENENSKGELEEIKDILAEYKHYNTVEELKELIQRALF